MSLVFVSSRVATVRHRELNARIAERCRALGLRPFLPQTELDGIEHAIGILEGNERAVTEAALVIAVFDGAGAGVAMELGRAIAMDKPIIGLRSARSEAREKIGMMLQGTWERLPEPRRARTLAELSRAVGAWLRAR